MLAHTDSLDKVKAKHYIKREKPAIPLFSHSSYIIMMLRVNVKNKGKVSDIYEQMKACSSENGKRHVMSKKISDSCNYLVWEYSRK